MKYLHMTRRRLISRSMMAAGVALGGGFAGPAHLTRAATRSRPSVTRSLLASNKMMTKAKSDRCLRRPFVFTTPQGRRTILRLIETNELTAAGREGNEDVRQDPFELIFEGRRGIKLESAMCQCRHARIGIVDMTISPFDEDSKFYQAVFG